MGIGCALLPSVKCFASLGCKSLYCSLHMSSSVDVFVFYIHPAKKFHMHYTASSDYFWCD